MSHSILSLVDEARAELEISESWRRLRAETDAAIPVFCYPQGDKRSFTLREAPILRRHGLIAALSALQGYATASAFSAGNPDACYAIPRFPYYDDRSHFVQIVSGLERLKQGLSGGFGR